MSAVDLESREEGVVIPVRAKPGARRNAIDRVHDGALRICVTAPPEKGKANKAIADVLAKALGASKTNVQLVSGESYVKKKFLVTGRTLEQVRTALARILSER